MRYLRLFAPIFASGRCLLFSCPTRFQITLHLLMHTLVECLTCIVVALLVEVVLIGSQRLFTAPLHILNQTAQSLLDLRVIGSSLIDISDSSRNQPMTRCVVITLN